MPEPGRSPAAKPGPYKVKIGNSAFAIGYEVYVTLEGDLLVFDFAFCSPLKAVGSGDYMKPVRFDFDFDKMIAAVTYLASRKLPELTKGKICKLLFLADRAHIVRFGRPIIGDLHCALEHGPILSKTLQYLDAVQDGALTTEPIRRLAGCLQLERRYLHPHFHATNAVELDALSRSDVEALAGIVTQYGGNTFSELRTITHGFAAYKRAWDGRSGNAADMSFEDLFEDEDADDIVVGAKEEMIENSYLRDALA